jgi:hypothetical protein
MKSRILVLLVLAPAGLALVGCRTTLAIGQRGPVVTRGTPSLAIRDAIECPDTCTWTCGPRRARPFHRWQVEVEGGPVWQTRNDAALPGDTGTRFALDDVTGAGPFPYGRVTVDYRIAPRHAVRLMVAPLEIEETGILARPVTFDGLPFAPGVPTRALYRFNSYRLTYRYLLGCGCDWALYVGATAKIRDAKIELQQGATLGSTTDLGFVPLLHVAFEKRLAPRWRLVADLDGAAAPQGRAFDFALKLHHDLSDRWSVGLGYRMIEGGADNDTVYTFAWFHQAVLSVSHRF